MDGQEPGNEYHEFYDGRIQMPPSPYLDDDTKAESVADHPRPLPQSAPASTSSRVTYTPYAAPDDNMEQRRIHFISTHSDPSVYTHYPMEMVSPLNSVPHLDHRQGTRMTYQPLLRFLTHYTSFAATRG